MAKRKKMPEKPTRAGQPKEGWSKQNIQLPDHVLREFREQAGQQGHGGIKILSAAAITFLLSLDQSDINLISDYVRQITWNDSSRLKKHQMRELVRRILNGESVLDESRMIEQSLESAPKKSDK